MSRFNLNKLVAAMEAEGIIEKYEIIKDGMAALKERVGDAVAEIELLDETGKTPSSVLTVKEASLYLNGERVEHDINPEPPPEGNEMGWALANLIIRVANAA